MVSAIACSSPSENACSCVAANLRSRRSGSPLRPAVTSNAPPRELDAGDALVD